MLRSEQSKIKQEVYLSSAAEKAAPAEITRHCCDSLHQ